LGFDDFSYKAYGDLMHSLLSSRRNLCFKDCVEENPEGSYLILRHDVDFSPEAACRMAEFEARLDIKASYFILLSSPYYNLLSEEYIDFPRRLTEMGHEIGLHYDVNTMEKASRDVALIDVLHREIDVLSHLAEMDVTSIAMHNPSLSGFDPFRETRFTNVYADAYTKDIAYFSDSCGAWRDEFAERFEENRIPMQLQLLIHPIFWSASSSNRWEILDSFVQGRHDLLMENARRVKTLWRNHTGVDQHDRRRGGDV